MHVSISLDSPLLFYVVFVVLLGFVLGCFCFNIVSKQSSDYYIGVDFMEQSPSAKLQFIVGDIGYAFNNDIGIFYDFIGKMYIETCFRLRSEVLSVTV